MESDEVDCNPPPPHEILEDSDVLLPDKIGETMFSKHWLFQSLLKIMQAVEKEKDLIEKEESPVKNEASPRSANETKVLELDPEIEERVCTLWDMSSDSDVAHFLLQNRAVEIFMEIINVSVSPRLVETVVGVLGNMAFFSDICEYLTKTENLIEQVVDLIGSSDSPTLIQVVRLIHVCVANESSNLEWLTAISKNNQFIQSVTFILENSLNGELLKSTLQMVYCILDKDEQKLLKWNVHNLILSVNESGKQLLQIHDYKSLDEYWHTLYFLLQIDKSSIEFDENFNSVCYVFKHYIIKQKDSENCVPSCESLTAVAASITVFMMLTSSSKVNYKSVITDYNFLRCIEEMFGIIKKELCKITSSENGTPINSCDNRDCHNKEQDVEKSDDNSLHFEHLNILHDSLKELCDFVIT